MATETATDGPDAEVEVEAGAEAETGAGGKTEVPGLVGEGGILQWMSTGLARLNGRRGEGYVSPRAWAAARRRSVSALLGRPRLRGGSPPGPMADQRGESGAGLSLL